MKARCNGLASNYKNWKTEQKECAMYNSIQPETIIHFIGEWSILSKQRLLYLNLAKLSEKEVIVYLNGENWKAF